METKTVSEAWYNHLREVEQATKNAQQKLLDTPGISRIGATASDEYIGDRHKLQIEIGVEPSRLQTTLADRFEGQDVTTEEVGKSAPLCVNVDDYPNVPGGVVVENNLVGTSGCKVTDSNGNPRLLTASHLFSGRCAQSDTQTLNQNGDAFGVVTESHASEDWAIVKPNSNYSLDNTILEEDGFRRPISGFYSSDGVSDIMCGGGGSCADVYSMGVTTGLTEGNVQSQWESRADCPRLDSYGIKLDLDSAEGDSGGPTYGTRTFNGQEYAVMLNIVNAGENEIGTTSCSQIPHDEPITEFATQFGIAIYHLHNFYNIS